MTQTTPPEVPMEEYSAEYFERYNYADRPLGKYSMYWFARRYYAALVRRYAPPGVNRRLLELGCGLGHMLGLLQNDFQCVGIDLIDYSIQQTKLNAPHAEAYVQSADDLSNFEAGTFSAVVALHLVEHLPDPQNTIRQVNKLLKPDGLFLFATPNPVYSLRRYKDHQTDAIGKDPTHINVHPPEVWHQWAEANGFKVVAHFGDGLWDVPYLKGIPTKLQFAAFGFPAFVQVMTQTTFTPLSLGVNQVCIARKIAEVS
ncbi:MAG: class I SAM-dependent methyltransferase [Anaerolineae bacterium]|nr:class I SAM-dependent methyltransferase [Anaerolineae bacterium]